jgi:hypothetical protein
MTKAKKAPQKKTTASNQNRGVKIASGIFIAIGILVVLSMIVSSIFTVNQPVIATPFPTNVPAPTAAP